MVQLEAGPSSGSPEGDLEWPCPDDPSKARFHPLGFLRASALGHFWGQGHVVVSELTKLSMKLESAQKQAQFALQLVEGNL